MQQVLITNFKQKSDDGCKDETELPCKHCGETIKEKDIIIFAGYDIYPLCMAKCR